MELSALISQETQLSDFKTIDKKGTNVPLALLSDSNENDLTIRLDVRPPFDHIFHAHAMSRIKDPKSITKNSD